MNSLQDKISGNIRIDDSSGCWIWQGAKDRDGYGTMWVGPKPIRKRRFVHRMSYEAYREPIPKGLEIDHLCRVKDCCNPGHLEVVTTQENTRRRDIAHGYDKHCRRGHERNEQNVHITPQGKRECRPCKAERARRIRAAGGKW